MRAMTLKQVAPVETAPLQSRIFRRPNPATVRFSLRFDAQAPAHRAGTRSRRVVKRTGPCPSARFTGWDHDGGYAEYATGREDFAYAIPDEIDDVHAAPLLCAGIIGYRAIKRDGSARPGGILAIAGIYLSQIPPLDYERYLFYERELRTVTAKTRADGEEFLRIAGEIPIRTFTVEMPLEQANEALRKLKSDELRGAAVLRVRN